MNTNQIVEEIVENFLSNSQKVMVIGASNKTHRAGHYVPKFLQSKGFSIIPVNPNEIEVFGEKCLSSIDDYNDHVDGVIVYRKQSAAEETALKLIDQDKTDLIWFPDNITSEKVKKEAESAGIQFIQDRCPLRDYRELIG